MSSMAHGSGTVVSCFGCTSGPCCSAAVQEFNLFSALPVPPEELASFDADDLASKFGLTPDP